MEDLVGVGVADSGEDARVGEDALKGVVFRGESVRELFEAEGEDVYAAGIELGEGCLSLQEVEGGTALRTGLCQDERAVGEVEAARLLRPPSLAPTARQ